MDTSNDLESEAYEGDAGEEPAQVLREILHALETPGAIDPNFAAHLSRQLHDALAELQHPARGTAFNGRTVAHAGALHAGDTA